MKWRTLVRVKKRLTMPMFLADSKKFGVWRVASEAPIYLKASHLICNRKMAFHFPASTPTSAPNGCLVGKMVDPTRTPLGSLMGPTRHPCQAGVRTTCRKAICHMSFCRMHFVECHFADVPFADVSKSRNAKSRNAICRHTFLTKCQKSECQFDETSICHGLRYASVKVARFLQF